MLFVSTVQAQEVLNDSISYQPAISESKTELVQTSNAGSEQSVSKADYAAHPINLGEEALCFETNIVSLPYGQSRTISVGAIDIAIRDTF